MTVYADISFFINFLFDAEIIALLCKVFSRRVPKLRAFFASALGGLTGIFVFIPYLEFFARTFWCYVIPIFIVFVVFSPKNLKNFFEL